MNRPTHFLSSAHNFLRQSCCLFTSLWSVFLSLAIFPCVASVACAAPDSTPLYFASPEKSVTRTTELLRARNWVELTRYYDLAGSGISRSTLEDGTFFLRTDPPENAHPGGLWKFREPFAPGYAFISAEPSKSPGVVDVTVGIAIDEGGGLVQRGRMTYQFRKTIAGYQLLPKTPGDPAYAATGGISRTEAAERAGVDDKNGSWHAVYSPALNTWFFASSTGKPVALERVPVANPLLPPKAPPGFEPKPWRWTRRALPVMDVIAIDELAAGSHGITRFRRPVGGFDDLLPKRTTTPDEVDVPREKIWEWLDRARDRGLRVHVFVDNPSHPDARAVLSLMPPVK